MTALEKQPLRPLLTGHGLFAKFHAIQAELLQQGRYHVETY